MWAFDFCCNVVRFQDWLLRRKRFQPTKKATSKGERAVVASLKNININGNEYRGYQEKSRGW